MDLKQEEEQLLRDCLINQNLAPIVKYLFEVDLTPTQEKIVLAIAYGDKRRIVISCMTRYGKSYCVAIGILLYILLHENKRILLISPLMEQSKIIRNYISTFIFRSKILTDLLDKGKGFDRLKVEISKNRVTFANGNELKILSAEGEGNRLMGHGGDLIVLDEACSKDLKYDVYRSKISRMLGDNPDSILVEIGNPWHRNNQMYEHWIDDSFYKIHVDWKVALEEGRISTVFLEEQRKLLTSLEFMVLYDANFPDQSEDSLFSYSDVEAAMQRKIEIPKDKARRIISVDVADKGKDHTVIMWGAEYDGLYVVEGIYTEDKSENMKIADKIINLFHQYGAHEVKVDTIGVGVGVVSRLRQLQEMRPDYTFNVIPCHFGEGVGGAGLPTKPTRAQIYIDKLHDSEKRRFLNRKAQQYWRLAELVKEGRVQLPNDSQLKKDLMSMGWEMSSSADKIKIVDPEDRSPDWADCCCYFTWKDSTAPVFDFGKART